MKTIILHLFLLFAFTISLQAQMAIWETKNSGTINGVKFKLHNLDESENSTYEWVFSNQEHFRYPLDKKGIYCTYAGSDNWHLSFDKNLKYLHLYIGVWRPGVYKFSEPFRLLSHSSNIKKINNYLIIEGERGETYGGFGDAIIVFQAPLCCLFVESSRDDNAPQILTFGLYDSFHYESIDMSNVTKKTIKDKIKCRKTSKLYPENKQY